MEPGSGIMTLHSVTQCISNCASNPAGKKLGIDRDGLCAGTGGAAFGALAVDALAGRPLSRSKAFRSKASANKEGYIIVIIWGDR